MSIIKSDQIMELSRNAALNRRRTDCIDGESVRVDVTKQPSRQHWLEGLAQQDKWDRERLAKLPKP